MKMAEGRRLLKDDRGCRPEGKSFKKHEKVCR